MNSNQAKFTKLFLLFFCVLTGIAILYPHLNYQRLLAQGDHGRDLYCFKMTFEGAMPYKDYWWQYGPLMPYYYAAFFRILGVSIQSVLFGKVIIVLLSGIVLFLSASRIMSLPMAFVSALFFWIFRVEFFYTYNHIGGVFLVIFTVYCLFLYHSKSKDIFVYLGLAGIFLLNLVRINTGAACLIAFLISLVLGDYLKNVSRKPKGMKFAMLSFSVVMALTGCVYYLFVHTLSLSALKQCFPYLSSYRPDTSSPLEALIYFGKIIKINFTATWMRRIFGVIFGCSFVSTIFLFLSDKIDRKLKTDIYITLLSLSIFVLFTFHEFILSATFFRIAWFFPMGLLLILFIIDIGLKNCHKAIYILVLGILVFINVREAVSNHKTTRFYKQPVNLFQYEQNNVYIENNYFLQKANIPNYPSENQWIKTVKETLHFFKKQKIEGGDTPILAIPYDSLYYFLSGQKSAVYPLAFFQYINISSEDEQNMIKQLEEKRVDTVLLSNRVSSPERPLGVFGKDYCPLLARYIMDHFEMVAQFGDWQYTPGFVEHHGIRVFQRNSDFQ